MARLKNATRWSAGWRLGQVGRQYIPVERTAYTNRPSALVSLFWTTSHILGSRPVYFSLVATMLFLVVFVRA